MSGKCGHTNSDMNRLLGKPCPTCIPTDTPPTPPSPKDIAAGSYVRLALTKVGLDDWKTTDRLAITSVFTLSPTKDDDVTYCQHDTNVCGLGWRFSFKHQSSDLPLQLLSVALEPYHYPSPQRVTITGSITYSNLEVPLDKSSMIPSAWQSYALVSVGCFPWKDTAPTGPIRLEVTVTIPHVQHPAPSFMPDPPAPVHRLPTSAPTNRCSITSMALDSITIGEMVDVQFVLHSKVKLGRRELSHPRSLFGSTKILEGVSVYLDSLVSGEHLFPPMPNIAVLDGDVDSDLEDDEDEKVHEADPDTLPSTLPSASPESRAVSPSLVSASSISTGAFDETDEGTTFPVSPSPALPFNGRTLPMPGYAYQTWKCLLRYLYTGEIHFAPLTSNGRADVSQTADACSPKSMYRLADKLALPKLKQRALAAIKSQITTQNVASELFSTFSLSYTEIQRFQLEFLLKYEFDQLDGLDSILDDSLEGKLSKESNALVVRIMRRWSTKTAR